MAGRADIQAGAAYIRLYVQNSALRKGLRDGLADVAKFSAGILGALGTEKMMGVISNTLKRSLQLGADEELKGLWERFTKTTDAALATIGKLIIDTFDLKSKLESAIAIAGAVAAGEFARVGELAMVSLNAAILSGQEALNKLLGEGWADLNAILTTNTLEENWELGLSGLAAYWDAFVSGITDVFTSAANAIIQVWQKVTSWISDKILENQRRLKELLDLVGLGERLLGPDIAPGDLAQAKDIARAQIGSTASGLQAALEQQRAARASRATASMADLGGRIAGGAARVAQEAAAARATAGRMLSDLEREYGSVIVPPAAAGNGPGTFGTFSAAAAAAGAGGTQDRIARGTEKSAKTLEKLHGVQMALLLATSGLAGALKHP